MSAPTYTFTSGEEASSERDSRIAAWIEAIPDDCAMFYAYYYDVPWAERRSVRDRSRLVTRRKQRRR